jgi:integrase
MNFTTTWVDRLKPSNKRQEYTEDGRPGFMLYVNPGGRKTFVYRYQIGGNSRRKMVLGTYPSMTLAEAHEAHSKALKFYLAGHDPARFASAAASAISNAPTVADIIKEWIELYARKERKRPEQAEGLLNNLDNVPRRFLDLKAPEVTKRLTIDWVLDPIVKRGAPSVANDVASLLKQIWAFSESRDRLTVNVLSGLSKPGGKEKASTRWLTDPEIKVFWNKLDEATMSHPVRYAIRLLFATAQRRIEIATMQWKHIDFRDNVWTQPPDVAKNGVPHAVPLSPLALKMLEFLKGMSRGSDYVLPSSSTKKGLAYPLTERALTRALDRSILTFGIEPFSPHDLRRTARTNMGRLGIPPHVSELVLNHKKKGMVEVYDMWQYLDEKREALNKWASHIETVTAA